MSPFFRARPDDRPAMKRILQAPSLAVRANALLRHALLGLLSDDCSGIAGHRQSRYVSQDERHRHMPLYSSVSLLEPSSEVPACDGNQFICFLTAWKTRGLAFPPAGSLEHALLACTNQPALHTTAFHYTLALTH